MKVAAQLFVIGLAALGVAALGWGFVWGFWTVVHWSWTSGDLFDRIMSLIVGGAVLVLISSTLAKLFPDEET